MLKTVLVISHHTAVTYGAPEGWYIKDPATSEGALISLTWFVAALLLFTFFYRTLRKWFGNSTREIAFPGRSRIVLFALAIGLVTYLVRIFFPIGWVLKPLGFQPAHFSQYIALYTLGLLAAQNNWLARLPVKDNRFWIILSACLVFLGFPGLYLVKIITGSPLSAYTGEPVFFHC